MTVDTGQRVLLGSRRKERMDRVLMAIDAGTLRDAFVPWLDLIAFARFGELPSRLAVPFPMIAVVAVLDQLRDGVQQRLPRRRLLPCPVLCLVVMPKMNVAVLLTSVGPLERFRPSRATLIFS